MKRKLLAVVLAGTMIAQNGLPTYASDIVVQSDTEVSDFGSEETVSDVQEETAEPEDEVDSSEQEEVLPNEEEKEEISGDDPLEDVITEGEEPAEEEENISDEFGTGEDETQQEPQELFGDGEEKPEEFSAGEEEILPATASADDLVYGDLTYRVNNNKVTITGYKGSGTSAVIPAKIGSYEVKEIADRAFSGCGTLESISLPEGLERIGYQFIANTGITSLTVPSTVTASGYAYVGSGYAGATAGAMELQEVKFAEGMKKIPENFCRNGSPNSAIQRIVLPSTVTEVGNSSFQNCAGLETVNFGKEVGKVGDHAFAGCVSLSRISFEENSKQVVGTDGKKRLYPLEIGSDAFAGCSSLTEIDWSKNVKIVGTEAFYGCTGLTAVQVPENVTSVGDRAFGNCSSLENISLPEGLENVGYQFIMNTGITSLTVPSTVTASGYAYVGSGYAGATAGAMELQEVKFAEGMKKIPENFCRNGSPNSAIQRIVLPSTVMEVGNSSFQNCAGLETVNFGKEVGKVGDHAFAGCVSLSRISFEENSKQVVGTDGKKRLYPLEIGSDAFAGCSSLTEIDWSKNVKIVGTEAFYGCTGLTAVQVPENVTSVGDRAFGNCSSLENISLPEGLENVGYQFIMNTGITSLTVPSTVTASGYAYVGSGYAGATAGAMELQEVKFAEGMKKIPENFCRNGSPNSAIQRIVLPSTVMEVGNSSFQNCAGLETVNFGKEVGKVGDHAFAGCVSLSRISFEENSKQVVGTDGKKRLYPLEIGSDAFAGCSSLTEIDWSKNVKTVGTEAFYGCTGLTAVQVPENVTSVGDRAFGNCSSLENISLPEGLENVGYQFIMNTGITSLTVPSTVTASGYAYVGSGYAGATAGAMELQEVKFAEGMKKIPENFCRNGSPNSAIQRIVLPSTVMEVGNSSFQNCAGLETVNFGKEVGKVGDHAFAGCVSLSRISFEENSKQVVGTDGKKRLYPLEIGSDAFAGCSSLTEIDWSKNVKTVGTEAFYGCTGLTAVQVPENVTSVGDRAFGNCSSLENISLPEGLENVGYQFIMNTGITSLTVPSTVTRSGCAYVGSGYAGATAGDEELKEIIFTDGAKTVPDNICRSGSENYSLKRAVIPSSVTTIGNNSFTNCKELTIYGEKNSYAENYAREKGILFCEIQSGKITRYDTAKKVLDKFPVENLINNIELKDGKIIGPQITVGGKTFNLFEVDAGMDLKLSDKVQAKVDMDTKTVQVLIGFKDFSGSATLDKNTNSTNYWSESYKQVKNIYTGMTGKKVDSTKLWNDFSKLRGKLRPANIKMVIDAKSYAAGYMEFSFASGDFQFQEGGIVLEASLGTDITRQIPSFPAAYCTMSLDSDFNGNLQLVKNTEMNYTLSMAAKLELAARLGIGLGVKKAGSYAEGGLFGKLKTALSLPASSLDQALTVWLNGGVYIESKVLGFDGPAYKSDYPDVQIYPQTKTLQAFDGKDVFDLSEFSAASGNRDYLESEDQKQILAGTADSQGTIFERDSSYPYSIPNLAELNDGTKIMVWIDDDGSKNNVNKTSLYASVYKNSKWSEPKKLYETGGLNDYPDVYTDGKKAYIVWQRTAQPLSQKASLADALKATNLYCITYTDGAFTEPELIGNSENTAYEMMQRVASDGRETAVVWVENSANDPFMTEGTNYIRIARSQGDGWKEETLAEGTDPVTSVDISYVNGSLAVVYETYNNDNNQIHLVYKGETKEFSGDNSVISEGILYYTQSGTMYEYNMVDGSSEESTFSNLDNFTVVTGADVKYLLTLRSDGQGNELYASVYDEVNRTWGNPVAVTNYGKYIRSYSAQIDEEGNLAAALNVVEVNKESGEFTDQAGIMVVRMDTVKDISISGVTYDDSMVKPGGQLPLHFTVTNNSLTAVEKFQVTLTDEDGKKISSGEVSSHLEPGASAEAAYIYRLSETLTLHKIVLTAEIKGETNKKDNSEIITIGYGNLVLDELHLTGTGSKPAVSGTLNNTGYGNMENVKVSVYETNASGKLLGTYDAKTLKPGETTDFSVDIPEEMLKVDSQAIGNVVYVNAETDSSEISVEDNSDYLFIDGEETENVTLNSSSLNLQAGEKSRLQVAYTGSSDISAADAVWSSSNEKVAEVNDGEVTAIAKGSATITAKIGKISAKCKVTVSDTVAVSSITLKDQSVRIAEGKTFQLEAEVLPENATNKKVNWTSSDETAATVDQNGLVTGIAAGTTVITAVTQDGGRQVTCTVSVTKDKTTEYEVQFQSEDADGAAPDTIKAAGGTRIILPENTFNKNGYQFAGWNDGNSVYQAGFAYRMPYGNIIFTAEWKKVTEKKVRRINVESEIQKQEGDEKFNLDASLSRGDGELKYSSDSDIVAVDASGTVTIKAAGKATISITAPENGEYKEAKASVEITVSHVWGEWKQVQKATVLAPAKEERQCQICGEKDSRDTGEALPASIKLNVTKLTMQIGQTTSKVKVSGLAEGDGIKKWKSSDNRIVKVSSTGKITAQKVTGKAVVTVELASGMKGDIAVTVQKTAVKTRAITGLEKKITLKKGKKVTLKPVLSPITAQEKISYTSSNKKIVSVTSAGVITAKAAGTAKITVKSGSKKAVVTVTVPKTVTKSISGIPSKQILKKGKSITWKVKLNPSNSDDKITYTSSNKKVAAVDSKGKITAKGKGTAIITVKSGKVSVKCKITVK